jgi:hypothetical protein
MYLKRLKYLFSIMTDHGKRTKDTTTGSILQVH